MECTLHHTNLDFKLIWAKIVIKLHDFAGCTNENYIRVIPSFDIHWLCEMYGFWGGAERTPEPELGARALLGRRSKSEIS